MPAQKDVVSGSSESPSAASSSSAIMGSSHTFASSLISHSNHYPPSGTVTPSTFDHYPPQPLSTYATMSCPPSPLTISSPLQPPLDPLTLNSQHLGQVQARQAPSATLSEGYEDLYPYFYPRVRTGHTNNSSVVPPHASYPERSKSAPISFPTSPHRDPPPYPGLFPHHGIPPISPQILPRSDFLTLNSQHLGQGQVPQAPLPILPRPDFFMSRGKTTTSPGTGSYFPQSPSSSDTKVAPVAPTYTTHSVRESMRKIPFERVLRERKGKNPKSESKLPPAKNDLQPSLRSTRSRPLPLHLSPLPVPFSLPDLELETFERDEGFMSLDTYNVVDASTGMRLYPSGSVSSAFIPAPNLHWQLLSYHPARPNLTLHFDVAFPTHDIEYIQDFSYRIKRTPLLDVDLDKPAADEKLTKMTIKFQCDLFKWDIDVERDEGIRVQDVLEAIYSAFDLPLTFQEKSLIPRRLGAKIEEAFRHRCNLAPVLPIVQHRQGWKRVDALLHETIFRGLVQSKRGNWTLHLSGTTSKAIHKRHLISDPIAVDSTVSYRTRGLLWDPILEFDTTAHFHPTPPALNDPREYLPPYRNQNPNAIPNYSNYDLFNLPLSAAFVPRTVMGSDMMLPSRGACRICNFARSSAILQHGTLCTLLDRIPPLTMDPLSQDYTWAFFCRFVPISALFDSPGRGPLPMIQLGSDRARLVDRLEANFENPSNAMLWLHGPSGTGKSVIAYTLASRCRQKDTLAGSFFFSPRHANCRNARSLVIALAYQLGLSQPQAKEKIIEALDSDPGIISPSRDLREQFARLLIEPLEAVDWRSPSRVFIIDAIDQCQDQVPELISLLTRLLSHMNDVGLHIFFTSRDYIKGVLIKRRLFPVISDIALDHTVISGDIRLFLRQSFDKIHKRHQLQCPKPWPPEEMLGRLVDRVGPRFITGFIIVKFVGSLDHDPTDRMDLIDHISLNPSSPSELSVDDFYKSIISTADDPEQAYLHLTIVVNLASMLSYSQLDDLLNRGSNQNFDMRSALSQLSPLVHTPDGHDSAVQICHESLCDFLSDPIRCGKQFIPQVVVHRLLAHSSLSVMMKELPDDSPLCSRLSRLATESDSVSLRTFDNAEVLSFAMYSPPEPLLFLSMLWHIMQHQYTGLKADSRAKLALQYFCRTWQVLQHLDLSAVDALPAFRFLANIRSLPVFLAFPIFLAFESPGSGQTLSPSTLEYDNRIETLDIVAEIVADVHALKDQRKTGSSALDYACTHWAYHLSLAEWDDDLRSIVTAFMIQKFQQWLLKAWCLQDLETCLRTLCGVRELCLDNRRPLHRHLGSDVSLHSPSPSSSLPTVPPPPAWVIMVTYDCHAYTAVDVTNANSAAFIWERIFAELKVLHEDQCGQLSIYRTQIGKVAIGEPLSDDRLIRLVRDQGDSVGSLKFLVCPSHARVQDPSLLSSPVKSVPPPPVPVFSPLVPRPRGVKSSQQGSVYSEDLTPDAGYEPSVISDYIDDSDNRSTMRPPPHPNSSAAMLSSPPQSARHEDRQPFPASAKTSYSAGVDRHRYDSPHGQSLPSSQSTPIHENFLHKRHLRRGSDAEPAEQALRDAERAAELADAGWTKPQDKGIIRTRAVKQPPERLTTSDDHAGLTATRDSESGSVVRKPSPPSSSGMARSSSTKRRPSRAEYPPRPSQTKQKGGGGKPVPPHYISAFKPADSSTPTRSLNKAKSTEVLKIPKPPLLSMLRTSPSRPHLPSQSSSGTNSYPRPLVLGPIPRPLPQSRPDIVNVDTTTNTRVWGIRTFIASDSSDDGVGTNETYGTASSDLWSRKPTSENNDTSRTPVPGINQSSSPPRPALHVTIPCSGPSGMTHDVPANFPASPNFMPQLRLPRPRTPKTRHKSTTFEESTWAHRPPPEDVYDRLDEFFPEHDLDKPVIEANSDGTSPTTVDHIYGIPKIVDRDKALVRPKKSIRIVAEEHKKRIDRVSRGDPSADNSIWRKRSTKLWGSRIEEVDTSSQTKANYNKTLPDSPAGGPRPIFKWVRGELIGKGTYGRVYLALNATTGEMIAVKQVEIPITASDRKDNRQMSFVQALKMESETLKDLDHPHIVQYLGFEETPTFLSIFLEYVPGGSVGSCLRDHGKFDEEVTKSFTGQILEGLEYLHSKNIIHRDLKADNILVEKTGICKISDFGISKRTDDLNGMASTAMQGTVFWMAPEVIHPQKKGYNSKIDIWSVGCVVLEMWAGKRPWSDDEAITVMFKVYQNKQPPPIPSDVVLSDLAKDFKDRCFAIDPEDRSSAADLQLHPYLELPEGWVFNDFK